MPPFSQIVIYALGFIWVVIASKYISRYFQHVKLPLITGYLVCGILVGPYLLRLITSDAILHLAFVRDASLGFIAFAAGAELFFKELKRNIKSIAWNTFGQVVIVFALGFLAVYLLADLIPFMTDLPEAVQVAIAILTGVVFVSRSPSSALAVINELRAKGEFTRTTISVILLKDVFVVVMFAVCFSITFTLTTGGTLDFGFAVVVLFNLLLTLATGYLLGELLKLLLRFNTKPYLKKGLMLLIAYGAYFVAQQLHAMGLTLLSCEIRLEPLLICLIASLSVTNYSRHRMEFQKHLNHMGPVVYAAFFTLTGAMLSVDVLLDVWVIALLFFGVRILTLFLGSLAGSTLAGDPPRQRIIGWMPYVTQAGVGIAIATEISMSFQGWGAAFSTTLIAYIVLNLLIGPPLFRWCLKMVGDANIPASTRAYDSKNALIFGYDHQSLALARELTSHCIETKIACQQADSLVPEVDIPIAFYENQLSIKTLETLEANKYETVVLMYDDEQNLKICQLLHTHVGTKKIIVRLHDRRNAVRFHKRNAIIINPETALVSLLDHFVRSPLATSLLLGMEKDKDTIDIEVQDKLLHGVTLRDLRLPGDVLVLSVKRKGQTLISHGYTRLRIGDVVTMVGSVKSLQEVQLTLSAPNQD